MRRRALLVGCVPAAALVAFFVAVQSAAFADESYHAVTHPNMLMKNNGGERRSPKTSSSFVMPRMTNKKMFGYGKMLTGWLF
jgi:hypothetical protein